MQATYGHTSCRVGTFEYATFDVCFLNTDEGFEARGIAYLVQAYLYNPPINKYKRMMLLGIGRDAGGIVGALEDLYTPKSLPDLVPQGSKVSSFCR
jgi:hypothetical protein